MSRFVAFCLDRPITTLTIHLLLLLGGALAVGRLPLNSMPNTERPRVRVTVPMPNADPRQVELEVTERLEEALATLRGVRDIDAESSQGEGQVSLTFDYGTDLDLVKLQVRERIARIRNDLPVDDIDRIRIRSGGWQNGDAVIRGRISAPGLDLSENYELLVNRIQRPLERIDGVGQVEMDGVMPLEIHVDLRQADLDRHGLRIDEISRRLSDANVEASLGEVRESGRIRRLRLLNTLSDVEDVRGFPVDENGLRLDQVAEITVTEGELRWGRHLNGSYAVSIEVYKESDANTVEVAQRVRDTIASLRSDPQLSGIRLLVWEDQGEQILESLRGLRNAGLLGSTLAVLILLVFLRRPTATLLVGMTIPISVLSALCWLFLLDRELNILTIVALMLGVGMLVDTAVVVVESIVRRNGVGDDPHTAAVRGTMEVATPIFASTLTSVVVFLPVLFGERSQQIDYIREVGLVITFTLLSSLFVSLTLIPMAAARIYRGGDPGMASWFSRIRRGYGGLLAVALQRRGVTLAISAAVLLSVVIPLGQGFRLDLSDASEVEKNASIFYRTEQGLDYQAMERLVNRVETILEENREELGYADVYSWYRDGSAWTAVYPPRDSLDEKTIEELRAKIDPLLPSVPGVRILTGDWGMFWGRRGSRSAGNLRIGLFGDSPQLLETLVDQVAPRLEAIPRVTSVERSGEEGVAEIRLRPDEEVLGRYELSSQALARRIEASFAGSRLREVRTKSGDMPLRVRLAEEEIDSLQDLEEIGVRFGDGVEVPLEEMGTWERGVGPDERRRENRRAALRFALRHEQGALSEVQPLVERVLADFPWPPGYSYEIGSSWRWRRQNETQFWQGALLAVFLVYMVMACLFESIRQPFALLVTVACALPGVIWFLHLHGDRLDQPAGVGLILLAGIVVNNGIVLIDHVNRHRREGLPLLEALRRGGEERLRPILITALTTLIGLIPMAYGGAQAAGTYYFTLARTIIGGLAVSTLLTLVVLPVIYSFMAGSRLGPDTARESAGS